MVRPPLRSILSRSLKRRRSCEDSVLDGRSQNRLDEAIHLFSTSQGHHMRTVINDKISLNISDGYGMVICSVNMYDLIIYAIAIPVNNHVDSPLIIFRILSF